MPDFKQKYFALVENIPGMVYRGLPDWSVEIIGRQVKELSGYDKEEFVEGRISWLDIIHPEDKESIFEESILLNTKASTLVQEYRIIRKDGNACWVQDHKRSFHSAGVLSHIDGVVFDITERKRMEDEEQKLIVELQSALAAVKRLSGLIPICSSCKKIRDGESSWHQVEAYIRDHSEAKFSHGFCPECAKNLDPELFNDV